MFTKLFLKLQNETIKALLVVLLISVIFLFPMFFGKVDTPIDIRNVQMYPWRYYSVDKHIDKIILWQGSLSSRESEINNASEVNYFELKVSPRSKKELAFPIIFSQVILNKLGKMREVSYYLSFDFKPDFDTSISYNAFNLPCQLN